MPLYPVVRLSCGPPARLSLTEGHAAIRFFPNKDELPVAIRAFSVLAPVLKEEHFLFPEVRAEVAAFGDVGPDRGSQLGGVLEQVGGRGRLAEIAPCAEPVEALDRQVEDAGQLGGDDLVRQVRVAFLGRDGSGGLDDVVARDDGPGLVAEVGDLVRDDDEVACAVGRCRACPGSSGSPRSGRRPRCG